MIWLRAAEPLSVPGIDNSASPWSCRRTRSETGNAVVKHTEARRGALTLDLVVCVDTMAAHLAGALGCRTWTLLHKECDWRWPLDGPVTAWYPTMRLFHQQRSGDWDSVIEELYSALQEESEKWNSSREPIYAK
jgi:hypothetical protein